MKTTITFIVSLAIACSALLTVGGCESDPHDTHITTGVAAPR